MMSNLEEHNEEWELDSLSEDELDDLFDNFVSELERIEENKSLSSFKGISKIKRFQGLDKERDRLFSFPLSNYKFYSQFTLPKAERQFDQYTRSFNNKLLAIVNDLSQGNISLQDAKTLGKKVINQTYLDSYKKGGEAVATNLEFHKRHLTRLEPSRLKPADKKWVTSASDHESIFFDNLLDQVASGEIYGKKYSASERVNMYARTLKSQFEAGKVAQAPFYSLIKWKINPALETCPSCIFLASKPWWTKETLPTTPRAGDTRCRFNCGCKLEIVPVTHEAYEKFKQTSISKAAAENMLKLLFK